MIRMIHLIIFKFEIVSTKSFLSNINTKKAKLENCNRNQCLTSYAISINYEVSFWRFFWLFRSVEGIFFREVAFQIKTLVWKLKCYDKIMLRVGSCTSASKKSSRWSTSTVYWVSAVSTNFWNKAAITIRIMMPCIGNVQG